MVKLATRSAIRARRLQRPSTGRRVPVQAYPEGIERSYERVLVSMVREATRGLVDEIMRVYRPAYEAARPTRADELAPEGVSRDHVGDLSHADASDVFGQIIDDREVAVFRTVSNAKARLLAQGVGRDTNRFVKTAVGAQVKAVIGVDVLATVALEPGAVSVAIDAFAARNVGLITSVPRQLFAQIRALDPRDAIDRGTRPETFARELMERTGVAESRARLIARDQIGKLQGQLTELRQKSIGISGYIWRTSRDERVRETHQALEGERFDWSSPPDTGHPGEDFQCRCRAEPDFGGLFDD